MKTVFGILRRDLKMLVRNPIALLVVGALLVLPGLYAWYCIVANWDPYSNTGNVPVAVVNQDRGASSKLTGEIDIGKQVVEKLEGNDSIDWRFYDSEDEAIADTRLSICYATIVLPEDLSENIIGIFEGSKDRPTIYYYPNEKQNAVATKVTDSAAQTLIRQINQQFSATVNETVLQKMQTVSDEFEERASGMNSSALTQIKEIRADIDTVLASLDDATGSIAGWKNAGAGLSESLSAASQQLPSIRAMLSESGGDLGDLRVKTGEFEGRLSNTLLESATTVSGLSARASKTMRDAVANLESVGQQLEALENLAGEDPDLQDAVQSLEFVNILIEGAVESASGTLDDLDADVQRTTGDVSSAVDSFSNQVMPQLDAGTYDLSIALSGLSGAIFQFEPQISELQNVLSQTDSALESATSAIDDAKVLLAGIGANLDETVTDLGALGSALQIDQISEVLEIEPGNLGEFISSPVHMVTEKIYPVSNYGTAVAPFYTNLALWIGCFILISLIKVEVDPKGFEEASPSQRYFGRWLLFVILSLLQSQVICGVDILLGIDCAHPALFMLAGAVCSFVYMNLIFALVIAFRNIGKTLCILLLILQVPGSSGMYPIEMMPAFFQFVHPALPFTYGINAMREALCGMYDALYVSDLCILLLVVPVALLLGLVLRPRLLNLTQLFDQEMSATGFFASEIHGTGVDDARIMGMMRTLATNDAYRDEIEERAWAFTRRYPKLRKAGSIATFAIPFVFLLIMLLFNELRGGLSVNTKLGWLMVMIILLLAVQVALIVLEYMHRSVTEQTRIMGLQILNESEFASDFDELLELTGMLLGSDEGGDSRAASENLPSEELAGEEDEGDAVGRDAVVADRIPVSSASSSAESSTVAPWRKRMRRHRKTGPTRDIFITDLRLGFKSVIGVVVIMLLVITPSMYAWLNIAGSWNPYGSTGNLKVAVANEDEGYKGDLVPVTINVGETVVSQLRGNTSFDWEFVTKDEAVSGVTSGEYYAAIEIPMEFSRNMMTYLIDDAVYPDVIYYTNEKENPIAPIITQKGADSIQENIRTSFTERIDEVVLSVAYELLNYVSNPRITSYVDKMGGHLDDATHDMTLGSSELKTLSSLSQMIAGVVDTTGVALDGIKGAGASAKSALSDAKMGAENATSAFSHATELVEDILANQELDVDQIKDVLDVVLALLEGGAEAVPDLIDDTIAQVDDLRNQTTDPSALAQIDSVVKALEKAREHAASIPSDIVDSRAEIETLIQEAKAGLDDVKSFFQDSVKPSVGSLVDELKSAGSTTGTLLNGLEEAIAGLDESTGGLSKQFGSLSDGLVKAGGKLETTSESLSDIKTRLAEALSSGDVRQIEAVLLGSDPEVMAGQLAAPIQENREALYPVANYGSSMAPFYTVLSLWVGALVMISTMRVHLSEKRIEELRARYGRIRSRNEFFGRYGIFAFISILQSLLVLLGDLFLLHIQCVNPVLFVLFGLFIGQVFCLIVFTLTELFGDVGKAVCVILLIMQVAASGGTFPVEMLDPILEGIVPFLPFYHAMSLLQECVAGIYLPASAVYVVALLLFVVSMLLIGVVVRKPFRKLNDFFEEQLEKTGYM